MAEDGGGGGDPKRRACFSFAAYAKAVIDHLRASGVAIAGGLDDSEFAAIKMTYGFDFPPDLRSILREGLPIGSGFPNWRSASPQQLEILLRLPVSGLLHEVSHKGFWCAAWGSEPAGDESAAARGILERAPVLVPIYRQFYIPTVPNLAGNPVFYVRAGDVRCAGFDLADFFQRERGRFMPKGREHRCDGGAPPAPAWAAKEARRVEVWTELAAETETWRGPEKPRGLEGWLGEMGWRLRAGGWGEEEVREMLMMGSGGQGDRTAVRDRESLIRHVRLLSLALLRAGWSQEDVADSMMECARSDDDGRKVTWQVDPIHNEISMEL
ncbi:uncharacterized protein LOC103704306 [Phoenix dactylifera]|uniref:Uncharacterized protein LOC103704306 n=1 Tax=Phoenix dactylifera TaxID=42345 RepID=A0A8B7BUR0_PHODC|nr:uncharacterized protein LOC103704306 [Phoenix dactylifera]